MAQDDDRPEDHAEGGFLSRWSRRKAEARTAEPAARAEPAADAEAQAKPDAIDPATLPPVESLTPESDFTLFLKKGVPPALRSAALKKLWLIEPSVVNYEALVEYNWDFTAPGYGEMLPTDDVAKFVKGVFEGSLPKPPVPAPPEHQPAESNAPPAPEATAEPAALSPAEDAPPVAPALAEAEPAPMAAAMQPPPRRRHGGALPG